MFTQYLGLDHQLSEKLRLFVIPLDSKNIEGPLWANVALSRSVGSKMNGMKISDRELRS